MTVNKGRSAAAGRTRQRLLHILKTGGARDAAGLAAAFGLTDMAVRRHLYALQANGMVDYTHQARPLGRPAKLWSLTAAADGFFPSGYADLAVNLIAAVTEAFGAATMDALLAARAGGQIRAYRSAMAGKTGLEARLEALARVRSDEGYMAEVATAPDDTLLLIENHCPIRGAAAACGGICANELEVFQASLGDDIEIERRDHILAGARRCAYRVTPGAAASAPPTNSNRGG